MLFFSLLVSDPLGSFLPPGLMNFVVPGALAAFLFVFVIYKLLSSWGYVEGI